MDEKYIGVIIKNQDDKILLYKNNYYIKIKVQEDEDISLAIKNALKKNVNQEAYRMVRYYDKAIKNEKRIIDKEDNIKMYVVEVISYDEKLKFIKSQELLNHLKKSPSKTFYELIFVKYKPYKELAEALLAMIMIFLSTIMMISIKYLGLNNFMFKLPLILQLLLLVVIFVSVFKYLTPLLVKVFMRKNIDIRKSSTIKSITTVISIVMMMGVATGLI
ncbi:hypothetical protein [Romboutsia lituseburensis]|uniref:hypothetical protein n=1 Tax=Romboutsia lituseburensis TaxID=1537 RepID=UPI00215ADAFA|nr:hypothetical protein [Romboutsia lituseburensis]MCR8743749.1 hypothetical protein [Romboutsia lituseburensis]